MPSLIVSMEGEGAWPDLPDREVVEVMGNEHPPIQIAVLDGGMKSGRPSISIRVDMPDGRVLVTETSARLFIATANIIKAKYPDLMEGF